MAITVWTEHGQGHRSSDFFARIAKELRRDNMTSCYVVPHARAKRRAELLCMASGTEIFFGDKILTTSKWLGILAKTDRPVLTDAQRHTLIRTLVKTIPLEYFRSTATAGTCTIISRGITAALNAGITPAQLHRLATDYGQEREQDLAKIFEAALSQIDKDRGVDAAQIPAVALNSLQQNGLLPFQRIIVEVGISPSPILWKILRALKDHIAAPDLHIVVPEYHRGRAEAELGELAREISPNEWVAPSETSTPNELKLYRAPHATAEYRFMAQQLNTATSVLALSSDPTLWLETCMSVGAVQRSALPLALSISPVSAPWFDSTVWRNAPTSASLSDWMVWWRDRLYPPDQIKILQKAIAIDDFACRTLRDIAQWETLWLHAAASTPANVFLSAAELHTLIDPQLQTQPFLDEDELPYTTVTLSSHLGEHIPELLVLDATQSLLPSASGTSPFFKSASMLPQDPNTQILRDAFPSTETSLQFQIAAWKRISGCASKITACYAITADSQGDQFPSLLLEAEPQNIPNLHEIPEKASGSHIPDTLLTANDTIAHLRQHMKDHTFSITELEAFADCPFRHFARYILGIKVPDEESPEIPAKDEGKIIHRIMEIYCRTPHPDLDHMFGEERVSAARQILNDILVSQIQTTAPLQKIQIERLLKAATEAVIYDFTAHDRLGDAALTPAHLEWTFGEKDTPPLVLHSNETDPVHIHGKVDRIDIHPKTKQLLLIDYKYRTTKSIINDIQKGRHLQIPLYLMAAQSAFPDFTLLGGLLFDLKQSQRTHGMARKSAAEFLGIAGRPKSLTKEDTWDDLLTTAATYSVNYAKQIREGQFPINEHTCEYCDWKGLLPWEE